MGIRRRENYLSREDEDDALIAFTTVATTAAIFVIGGIAYGTYKAASWGYSYFKGDKKTDS